MSRRWLLSLFFLSLPLLLVVQLTRARGVIRVDEAATRFQLRDEGPRISLAVENPTGKSFNAVVRLELLDAQNRIKIIAQPNLKIAVGSQKLPIDLPLKIAKLTSQEQSELLWYRLHYRVTPEPTAGIDAIDGLVSLSEITADLFEIHVASSRLVREDMRYRATVRAQHPLTGRPAGAVKIEAAITIEDDDTDQKTVLKAMAVTDRDGFAPLDFDLPAKINSDEIKLAIHAQRGSLQTELTRSIDLSQSPYIFVTTDKPIYQPGQILHTRVLAFGPAKRALANAPVTLTISDPDDETLFHAKLTTSRFGIANAEWTIPANTRLGEYKVKFSTAGDDSDYEKTNSALVKISRYDLPNFTVTVKPDHPYYLPEQEAQVEFTAEYLFGQPVKRGQVRIVRESERTWNYREQKYETKEGEEFKGMADANGIYRAKINLGKEQAALDNSDYERFRDLAYAAYFTDSTTNRTEQRRFDLRITKEAIHVYIIKTNEGSYDSTLLPLNFYLSTYYADGTPAQCRVVISDVPDPKAPTGKAGSVIRTIKTNRFGLAKIERLTLPGHAEGGDVTLNFLASDGRTKPGKHAEGFDLRRDATLRVDTDKTLYRSGEPIDVTLTSTERELSAMVEVRRGWVVVHSEVVRLRDGEASVHLPWIPEFTGELTIAAYSDLNEYGAAGSHTILYPRNRELQLGLQTNHGTYRPGTDAQLSFRVRSPLGRFAESALGVIVFDKAVEERARTDQEFGAGYHDSYRDLLRWFGEGDWTAGVGRMELDKIDMSKPVPSDLELAAEITLNQNRWYYPSTFGGESYEKNGAKVFGEPIKKQFEPLRGALKTRYDLTREYPADEETLRRILSEAKVDFGALPDPWRMPYRVKFSVNKNSDVLEFLSSGPDKRTGTADDFVVDIEQWPYFRSMGEAIDLAIRNYHIRTGGFIRGRDALRDELKLSAINLDALVDPWSHPYRFNFSVDENSYTLAVWSTGPNGKSEEGEYPSDDFGLWTTAIDYFAETSSHIDTALSIGSKGFVLFPQNDTELRAALKPAGIEIDELRDPWGHHYYTVFNVVKIYSDQVKIESHGRQGETPKERIDVKPVTATIHIFKLRSAGEDGQEGTQDDFDAGLFTETVAVQSGEDLTPQTPRGTTTFAGSTGAIAGSIIDPSGAVVPGVNVTATRLTSAQTFEATSDDDGKYILRNLPVGLYNVRFQAPGFQAYTIENVLVRSSNLVQLNASLYVGSVTATVNVTSSASASINTSSATVASTISSRVVLNPTAGKQQVATPRLREYFPETLVWQPSLETDKRGRALLNFKLADNITTWKIAVFGSTEDGQIGTAEKEIKAFQPFFVDLDPPRVLTEGDEISSPVVVRNYLERRQAVDLEIKPETWFTLLGPTHKRTEVAAGDAVRETFDLRAVTSISDGKQRITATAAEDNDAIEKPVTVHPDGEEQFARTSDIITDTGTLDLNLPENAIPSSVQAELKIYPNLMAHVIESVEAIMKRPYGCGEQTISSTYPSLLMVRHFKQTGEESPLRVRAQRYLQDGYDRLLNYRDGSGGFTYWGRGEPDIALTAYALRFLNQARDLIAVDEAVIESARSWLIKRQSADGSFQAHDYYGRTPDKNRTALLTAYVARVLAITQAGRKVSGQANSGSQKSADSSAELKRALDYLAQRSAEIDEPYILASYALAADEAGDPARAGPAIKRLRTLVHHEGETSYWSLETNTPFYGWGLAGRVETTALVVQALSRSGAQAEVSTENPSLTPQTLASQKTSRDQKPPTPASPTGQTTDPLVRSGLLFLLKQKDRYGVWYSTQTTINVLDTMWTLLAKAAANDGKTNRTAQIIVNGQAVQTIQFPLSNQLIAPINITIGRFIKAGSNRIEIQRATGSFFASTQAVANYYVPWPKSGATKNAHLADSEANALRLSTTFDRLEGKINDEITCHVTAERVGFHGYGMMLAEIGLPPGADVDRASLETAMKSSDWAISQYDVLPDRVVVYLWPRAGGVDFTFKFRGRFALKAKTAPSLIYDYYNPDARAVVAPVLFTIR